MSFLTAEKTRCPWPGRDPVYVAYHDTEWGVPERDGRALWEKLVLDGFQAGLSWITILRKREAFRDAYDGFDPHKIARYDETDVARLLANDAIIRSRSKIEASIKSAQAFLQVEEKGPGFAPFVWDHLGGEVIQNRWTSTAEVPTQTPLSAELSKALKTRGFKFCGPVIVYAWMQACGLVNDHLTDCFRHAECRSMRKG